VEDAGLVGGVLFDAENPVAAARVLFELLTSMHPDPAGARRAGLEPVLVESLRRRLPTDRRLLEMACASGAAWVLGRRSAATEEFWEVVASLPIGATLPPGLRRMTGETMIGLASTARNRIRFAAPYVDASGIGFLTDSIAAATRRGVVVELFDPQSWEPARVATAALTQAVAASGDPTQFRLVRTRADAPFAHLKVMVVDASIAYVGSANITAAGLAGRNLELGVLVRGAQVAVIDYILDLYQEQEAR
jgi:phosphatidylserine/phosphatidylglycerophosphate/cardiolipin synthase-like enzyme